jgi:hypothetical protein
MSSVCKTLSGILKRGFANVRVSSSTDAVRRGSPHPTRIRDRIYAIMHLSRRFHKVGVRFFIERDCFVAPLLAMTDPGHVIASEAKQSPKYNVLTGFSGLVDYSHAYGLRSIEKYFRGHGACVARALTDNVDTKLASTKKALRPRLRRLDIDVPRYRRLQLRT